MIYNILDQRERRYRWAKVNAIIESTSGDNGVADSDQVVRTDDDIVYSSRNGISLREAISWANAFFLPVTLHLYDCAPEPD